MLSSQNVKASVIVMQCNGFELGGNKYGDVVNDSWDTHRWSLMSWGQLLGAEMPWARLSRRSEGCWICRTSWPGQDVLAGGLAVIAGDGEKVGRFIKQRIFLTGCPCCSGS